eukprot:scaffold301_cov370-Pavlova_lutheri.AAC.15
MEEDTHARPTGAAIDAPHLHRGRWHACTCCGSSDRDHWLSHDLCLELHESRRYESSLGDETMHGNTSIPHGVVFIHTHTNPSLGLSFPFLSESRRSKPGSLKGRVPQG